MSLTIADLLASPDHYLQRFDRAQAVFVPMDRAAYHRSIFLDARIAPAMSSSARASSVDPQCATWNIHATGGIGGGVPSIATGTRISRAAAGAIRASRKIER